MIGGTFPGPLSLDAEEATLTAAFKEGFAAVFEGVGARAVVLEGVGARAFGAGLYD